jgi:uncharacterized protein
LDAQAAVTAAVAGRSKLGAPLLRAALIAGADAVIAERDSLNEMNVFPVPDGDTGSNMGFTFGAIRDFALLARHQNLTELTHGVAMAAIDGARGNSGAIVAQYFYSLAQALKGKTRVGLLELKQSLMLAAKGARQALVDPKEGTVLSVMQAFAAGLDAGHHAGYKSSSLVRFFAAGLHAAERALAQTKQQLAVLAAHDVLDAGGSGFVSFLRGIAGLTRSARAPILTMHANPSTRRLVELAHDCDSAFRFCCECALEAVDIDGLRLAITNLAQDSVVLAGGQERAHLHCHTNEPARLFELAARFGKVSQRKADDMHAQLRARANPARVAIVCDSAADLPESEIKRLFIHTVPVRVNFAAEEFIDRVTLSPEQFYTRLRSDPTPVRTSQPPSGEFRRLFDQLASFHEAIVCLNLSAKLSGTYQGALAAAQHGGSGKAFVLDTRNAAAGEALVVLDAAIAAQAGFDAAQILARAHTMAERTYTFALIRDAQFLSRGGRVPRWVALLTRWLKLNLLIANEGGKIKLKGVLVGSPNLAARFARWALAYTAKKTPAPERQNAYAALNVIVGHCDCVADAFDLSAAIRHLAKQPITALHQLAAGVGIGAHAGPGTLVLGVQRALALDKTA